MECVNSLIAAVLARSMHPDLLQSVITPSLVAQAADALSDLFLSEGLQLAYGFEDGVCVTQTYHSQSTREHLDGVEFTLLQVTQSDHSQVLALAVRTTPAVAFSNSRKPLVFSGAIRINGAWFSTLHSGVGIRALISALMEQPKPKCLFMHKLSACDPPTSQHIQLGGMRV